MNFFDDMLNVNAYLRMQMQKNLRHSQALTQGYANLEKEIREMNQWADDTFARLQKIAGQLHIDISEQETLYASAAEKAISNGCHTCTDLRVKLPKDYDYEAAFQQLCQEAHAAGFTDIHPEQLLTKEEMQHAREFDAALDLQFENQTKLTKKDMGVAAIAVAIRVLCYAIMKKLRANRTYSQSPSDTEPVLEPQTSGSSRTIDASSGVSMETLLGSLYQNNTSGNTGRMNSFTQNDLMQLLRDFPELLQKGSEFFSVLSGRQVRTAFVRSEVDVLHGPVPFDVPDNRYFSRSEIAGFDKFAGWIIGVLNILTDTVTTLRLESYSVAPADQEGMSMQVDEKVSSVFHVLFPVIYNLPSYKDALLASVVREAGILNITPASAGDMSALLENVMYYEQKNNRLMNHVNQIVASAAPDWAAILGDTAVGSFLNKLIAAIHAVFYNPSSDGDLQMYAVRTNRLLILSSGIAAAIDSVPAAIAGNYADADWGGILTTLLNAFQSVNFWIEIKSQYLASEYKKELDRQLALLDEYIEYV